MVGLRAKPQGDHRGGVERRVAERTNRPGELPVPGRLASLWVAPGAKTGAIPSEHRARIGASGTLRFAHRGIMELNGQAPRWTTLTDRAQVTSPNPVGSRLLLGLRLRCRQ